MAAHKHDGAAAPGPVTPTSDEAPAGSTAQGFRDQDSGHGDCASPAAFGGGLFFLEDDDRAWELDALSPVELRRRVASEIADLIDGDAWAHAQRIEAAQMDSLQVMSLAACWPVGSACVAGSPAQASSARCVDSERSNRIGWGRSG